MKHTILLTMSLFAILFGCNTKKTPSKAEEWPRFPATDQPEITVTPIHLADGFRLRSFYVMPYKQNIYVLGSRAPQESDAEESSKYRPVESAYMDYRLLCLDAKGQVKYQKDMLRSDWMYGGTFGLLQDELMLRIGDWFLVLEPKTLDILEKIDVHNPKYVSSKETVMTPDEHRADYQAKFDALVNNCKACKYLYWSPSQENMVFVQGAPGKRAAWQPPSFYEEDQIADLKQRFELLLPTLNSQVLNDDSSNFEITDASAHIREVESISGSTQLVYPNYKSRTVLQYELIVNGKKIHFSTSDKDGHDLRLFFSDNMLLSMKDGAVWVAYEGLLYRMFFL